MPLTTDTKMEILELYSRYHTATDTEDTEAWLDTWADDGIFERPDGTSRGKDELKRFEIDFRKMSHGKRNLVTNVMSDGDGDKAECTAYLTVIEATEIPQVVVTSMYHDTLVKVDGAWKFAHRRQKIDPGFQKAQEAQGKQ